MKGSPVRVRASALAWRSAPLNERTRYGKFRPRHSRKVRVSVSYDTDRGARAGQNEALFREVNERVKELNTTFDALARHAEWICECANTDCLEPVQMTH